MNLCSLSTILALALAAPAHASKRVVAPAAQAQHAAAAPVPAMPIGLSLPRSMPGFTDMAASLGVPGIRGTTLMSVKSATTLSAAPASPMQKASERMGALGGRLEGELAAAGQPDSPDPKGNGERIEKQLTGEEQARRTGDAEIFAGGQDAPSTSRLRPFVADSLDNPAALYARAFSAAREAAHARGFDRGSVVFRQVTGETPVRDGKHLDFEFYAGAEQAVPVRVYVGYQRSLLPGRDYDERVSLTDAKVAADGAVFARLNAPGFFIRGSQLSPDTALMYANKKVPGIFARAGFSLAYEQDEATGDTDLWYRFYDDAGNIARVNARTGAAEPVRVIKNIPDARPSGEATGGQLAWGAMAYAALAGLIASALSLTPFGAVLIVALGSGAVAFTLYGMSWGRRQGEMTVVNRLTMSLAKIAAAGTVLFVLGSIAVLIR